MTKIYLVMLLCRSVKICLFCCVYCEQVWSAFGRDFRL